jgi:hypothetical protein
LLKGHMMAEVFERLLPGARVQVDRIDKGPIDVEMAACGIRAPQSSPLNAAPAIRSHERKQGEARGPRFNRKRPPTA